LYKAYRTGIKDRLKHLARIVNAIARPGSQESTGCFQEKQHFSMSADPVSLEHCSDQIRRRFKNVATCRCMPKVAHEK